MRSNRSWNMLKRHACPRTPSHVHKIHSSRGNLEISHTRANESSARLTVCCIVAYWHLDGGRGPSPQQRIRMPEPQADWHFRDFAYYTGANQRVVYCTFAIEEQDVPYSLFPHCPKCILCEGGASQLNTLSVPHAVVGELS